MARRVYIPGNKSKAENKDKVQSEQGKKQTAAVRQAAMAIIKRTREKIDPKILEVARNALPQSEEDRNKLFFGERNLLNEETVPVDREKNIETVLSLLESDKVSDSFKVQITSAMKELTL